MRADRLISILLLLQNHGQMTSKQLADKLEVSERTVHRDMEALSAAGIPVYSERGSQGGWKLTEGYRTSLTGLKSEEL
ncbi:MAG: YafY family transcriptional regulator, partial [Paenibacillus sp.]|nr:YafY family transcriptional regulator [Paenibacillus sp.]